MTINELKQLKETENKVEFQEAEGGRFGGELLTANSPKIPQKFPIFSP